MEVILLEHVEKLGKMGDKVNVKNGYARNYLLPQNKALRATESNVAYFEKQKAELEARNQSLFEEASKKAAEEAAKKAAEEAEETEATTDTTTKEAASKETDLDDIDLGTLDALESFNTHEGDILLEDQTGLDILTENDLPSPADLDADIDFSENN